MAGDPGTCVPCCTGTTPCSGCHSLGKRNIWAICPYDFARSTFCMCICLCVDSCQEKCVWPALGLTTTYQSSVSLHTTYKRYFVTTCFCLSNSIFFFFFFLFLQNRTRLSMMKEQCPWFRGMKSLTGGFGGRMNNTSGRHERSYSGEILLKITITSSQERGNPDAVWPEHWALQCI